MIAAKRITAKCSVTDSSVLFLVRSAPLLERVTNCPTFSGLTASLTVSCLKTTSPLYCLACYLVKSDITVRLLATIISAAVCFLPNLWYHCLWEIDLTVAAALSDMISATLPFHHLCCFVLILSSLCWCCWVSTLLVLDCTRLKCVIQLMYAFN